MEYRASFTSENGRGHRGDMYGDRHLPIRLEWLTETQITFYAINNHQFLFIITHAYLHMRVYWMHSKGEGRWTIVKFLITAGLVWFRALIWPALQWQPGIRIWFPKKASSPHSLPSLNYYWLSNNWLNKAGRNTWLDSSCNFKHLLIKYLDLAFTYSTKDQPLLLTCSRYPVLFRDSETPRISFWKWGMLWWILFSWSLSTLFTEVRV